MRYHRRQAKFELRDSAKKGAFHVNTAQSESSVDSDDEIEERAHVAFGCLAAPADYSSRMSAPEPESLGQRLVTFFGIQFKLGEPNEKQMGIFT
jgi:hypothetical protein